jgi:RNA polymerase sigma factor (sigma-70 family)
LLLLVPLGVNIGGMPLSDATIRQHRAQVFKYLRRRAPSDELADDLTQEVFETAVAHLGALDQSQPLLAWLYRVAQNRLIDELRRVERRPVLVALDADALAEPAREFGVDVAIAIRRASMRLTDRDREILGLRLFAECSFGEVARRLHINEPAAKMRYVRALRSLRAELEQEGVTNE